MKPAARRRPTPPSPRRRSSTPWVLALFGVGCLVHLGIVSCMSEHQTPAVRPSPEPSATADVQARAPASAPFVSVAVPTPAAAATVGLGDSQRPASAIELLPFLAPSTIPYEGAGVPGINSQATGFFRAEQIDGRWWIIDPRGQGYYITGINGPSPGGMGASHNDKMVAITGAGGPDAWNERTASRAKEWGFNVATFSHEPFFWNPLTPNILARHGVAHTRHLSFGYDFWRAVDTPAEREQRCLVWTGGWNSSSDPFHPEWPAWCERYVVEQRVASYRSDQWLVGYFIDNERATNNAPYMVRLVSSLPAKRHCKQAFVRHAEQHFGTIAAFNRAFQTSYGDFTALLPPANPALSVVTDEAEAFTESYLELAAEAYYAPIVKALRKADPHHLILGGRDSSAQDSDTWLKVAGRHVDVYSLHTYRMIDRTKGIQQWLVDHYRHVHSIVKKPLFVTEWSFPMMEDGQPNFGTSGMMARTAEESGQLFRLYQEGIAELPFMIGSLRFHWSGRSGSSSEAVHYGVEHVDGTPVEALVKQAAVANRNAPLIHAHSTSLLSRFPVMDPGRPTVLPATVLADPLWPLRGGDELSLAPGANGVMELAVGSNPFARITAQVEQYLPQVHWPKCNHATVTEVREDVNWYVVTTVNTMNDSDTSRAAPEDRSDVPFSATMRVWLSRLKVGFCMAEILTVRNDSSRPWRLHDAFLPAAQLLGPDQAMRQRRAAPKNLFGYESIGASLGIGYLTLSSPNDMNHFRLGSRWVFSYNESIRRTLAPGEQVEVKNLRLMLFPYRGGDMLSLLDKAEAVIGVVSRADR